MWNESRTYQMFTLLLNRWKIKMFLYVTVASASVCCSVGLLCRQQGSQVQRRRHISATFTLTWMRQLQCIQGTFNALKWHHVDSYYFRINKCINEEKVWQVLDELIIYERNTSKYCVKMLTGNIWHTPVVWWSYFLRYLYVTTCPTSTPFRGKDALYI